mgnify:CR=1 FL=1|jgi:type II secretory pathway component PulM
MNWQQLNQKDKNKLIITGALLLAIILYISTITSMRQHNNNLQEQINSEQSLSKYLNKVAQQLARLPNHPDLTKQGAQKIIESLAKENKIKLNALIMQTNSSIISINNIAFNKLLDFLKQLKTKYGIVTTQSDLKRITPGRVNANFTLQFP